MKTYKDVFSELNRAALIPFFVIGDPDIERSVNIIKTAIDAGADILELGIPFSDPIADGPTIQKADIRALRNGMNIHAALDCIKQIKAYRDIPIGLLMYYNLIHQYGIEKFFTEFQQAGVNSVLIADMTVDQSEEVTEHVNKAGLDTVFMVTPITDEERMKRIASLSTGFVYTVSVLGVTGSREELSKSVDALVHKLKSLTDTPICVGFGISKPEHAAATAKSGADGVIIGSRIVQIVENNLDDEEACKKELTEFLASIKETLEQIPKN